jgi:bifunctional enzyme CysN/CysC
MQAASEDLQRLGIEEYLRRYQRRDLLRFLTCGSVDDGKSTLIGRLLHDSQMVYDDHVAAVRRATHKHGTTGGEVDFALFLDGLEAEREQGITIDVAYRYFSTSRRKFIIADTPGHEQYTSNMVTGASNCNLAVILVDARKGVLDQTRRHAFIAALLGIKHFVVAVNKMDLVHFSGERFDEIREQFTTFAAKLETHDVDFIPVSALLGDNVVHRSEQMPWYQGSPLLDYLETVHIASDLNLIDLRFPVQHVLRPNASFRGYAGTIASGVLRAGQEVLILPSGVQSRIDRIVTFTGELEEAFAPMAVVVTLVDDLDAGRGDMIVARNNVPRTGREMEAMLVWMSQVPLDMGMPYVIKHATVEASAVISTVHYRINVNTLHREEASTLERNEIGRVGVESTRMLAFDIYTANRTTGGFILIDRVTNETLAAGMILDRDPAAAENVTRARSGGIKSVHRAPGEGQVVLLSTESGEPAAAAASVVLELRRLGVLAWAPEIEHFAPADDKEGTAVRMVDVMLAMQGVGILSIVPWTAEVESAFVLSAVSIERITLPDASPGTVRTVVRAIHERVFKS